MQDLHDKKLSHLGAWTQCPAMLSKILARFCSTLKKNAVKRKQTFLVKS